MKPSARHVGASARKQHLRSRTFRIHRKAKLRESVGVVDVKQSLKIDLLNVDGLTETSLWDVEQTIERKSPDLVILLETKRRREEIPIKVEYDDYEVFERRRSDGVGDKAGGGIMMLARNKNGLVFKEYNPRIVNPDHGFVENERMWMLLDSLKQKTAICGVYMGFQSSDDRHGEFWNDIIYEVLQSEENDLRKAGYRVILKGDFNGLRGEPGGGRKPPRYQ